MAEHLHRTHLFSEYLEGELSLIQRQAVEAHLRACAACRQELQVLRQTVNVLQNLPPLTTPAGFTEKLYRSLDQASVWSKETLSPEDSWDAAEQSSILDTPIRTSTATKSPRIARLRKVFRFRRLPQFSRQVRVQLYACAALLGLSIALSYIDFEKPIPAPGQPKLRVAPHSELLSQQTAAATGKAIQPVDATTPSPEQPLLLETTLPTAVETLGASQPLRWRVTASEPALLRRQVKELAEQIEGAVVVREQENLLLISLPTQELSVMREKLTKLGTASNPENELIPRDSTTLLSITFVREPSVASPPSIGPTHFEGRS